MHGEMKIVYKIFVGKPVRRRPHWRPRHACIILEWIIEK